MIINHPDAPQEELKMPPVPPKTDPKQHGAEALPPPPPYSPPQAQAGPSSPTAQPPPSPQTPSVPASVFRPQGAQTVNHFELFSKHDHIAGTFLVDPLLPSLMDNVSKKLRRRRAKVWGKANRNTALNVAFRTRHGHIDLDMAVISQATQPVPSSPTSKVPAHVLVSTRHGRINVNMYEIQPGRSLDLQVESRHGKIVLFLPPTFTGPLVFNTRSAGTVSFLPAFAARTRTVRASDWETVVLCTPPDTDPARLPKLMPGGGDDDDADRCLVRTRHGRIVVGISGLDRLEEPAPGGGLFRALGRLFEVRGKAFGQYVETQARMLEKNVTERAGAFTQYLDGKADPLQMQPQSQHEPQFQPELSMGRGQARFCSTYGPGHRPVGGGYCR